MMFGILPLAIAAAVAPENTKPPTLVYPEFRVPKDGSGWIDLTTLDGGQIIIPVLVNGEPVRALIDTGFDQLVISKTFADAHHLRLTPWAKPVSFGGPSQMYSTPGVTLTVGHILPTKAGVFFVDDLGTIAQASTTTFDAVIGLPLLATFEWEVDQDHHRVRFLPSGTQPTDGGVAIRIGPANSRLLTTAIVNGHPIASTMIDTGSDQAVSLAPSTATEVGFRPSTDMMSAGVGGLVLEPVGDVRSLAVNDQRVEHIPAAVDPMRWNADSAVEAVLGMDYLQRFNMLVDLQVGKMRLSPRGTSPRPEPKSTSGIQSLYANGRLSIVHVMKIRPPLPSACNRERRYVR